MWKICKTYLSSTYAADIDISNDNKNLAIAETNLSGIQIKSGIRIISLEKIEQDVENATGLLILSSIPNYDIELKNKRGK